jgi:hypothetical protein
MDPKRRVVASLEATRQQVAQVLNHHSFARSRGPARLLMHLAEQLATNGGCPASQLELARVLGLPEGFDPNRNPLVRMHMSKLRRMLDRYARGDGRHDPVVLEIPRNNYRLVGLVGCTAAPVAGPAESSQAMPARQRPTADRPLLMIVEFEGDADFDGVREFNAAAGPAKGPEIVNAGFARDLAFWLVAELLESRHVVAVGPLLQERVRRERSPIGAIARRCGAPYYLVGEFSEGRRGLQLAVRVMETATGSAAWTDWMDDPTDLVVDGSCEAARRLATRIVNRLQGCPIGDGAGIWATSDEGLQDPPTPLAVQSGMR